MLCPVCNGLRALAAPCPECGWGAEDEGRWEDWSGPYSPYDPVTPTGSASANEAAESVFCQHLARCANCNDDFVVDVGAWQV